MGNTTTYYPTAEELGATRVLALNVLSTPLFRFVHRLGIAKQPRKHMKVTLLEPSLPMGLRDALVWNATNIERWIELGRRDASSITM